MEINTSNTSLSSVSIAQQVLDAQAKALLAIKDTIGDQFEKAVDLIYGYSGKVMVCGVGKSGHAAKKIAATLCSTGTPAIFLHPAEAVHGDLGVYHPGDPTILISKSGSTEELVRLIPTLRKFQSPIIAIVSNKNSLLAKRADIVLEAIIEREADPLGIVPTTSTIAAMALGDALASALMVKRNFSENHFGVFHPSGQLGRNILVTVGEVMCRFHQTARVALDSGLDEIVHKMTEYPQGAACVLDDSNSLLGIITEGDIRRLLLDKRDIHTLKAVDIMIKKPICTYSNANLLEALKLMEERPRQIYVLPVIEKENNQYLGLIRLHDIYQGQRL